MKTNMIKAALLCVACGFASAQDPLDTSGWNWEAPIFVPPQVSDFVRLPVSPEIADEAQKSLNDLRIVNSDGGLVPHRIFRAHPRPRTVWKDVVLVNRTHDTGHFARVTLDFRESVLKSRLRVRLSGGNYRRFVRLEGREDTGLWDTVDTAWLFLIHDGGREFRVDTIDFPPNTFRYLRLTVYNMDDEDERIEIKDVDVALHEPGEAEREVVAITVEEVEPDEDEGNVTIFQVDTGHRNLALAELFVNVSEPDFFYRRYQLRGRDAATEREKRKTETGWDTVEREVRWSSIGSGVLYRIHRNGETKEDLKIETLGNSYRHLELRIYNGDDAPLTLSSTGDVPERDSGGDVQVIVAEGPLKVTRYPMSMISFNADPEESYTLLFGNPKVRAPQYDLARAIEVQDSSAMVEVEAGVSKAHEAAAVTLPLSEQYKWVTWIVLIAGVLIVVYLIGTNLSKLGPPTEG